MSSSSTHFPKPSLKQQGQQPTLNELVATLEASLTPKQLRPEQLELLSKIKFSAENLSRRMLSNQDSLLEATLHNKKALFQPLNNLTSQTGQIHKLLHASSNVSSSLSTSASTNAALVHNRPRALSQSAASSLSSWPKPGIPALKLPAINNFLGKDPTDKDVPAQQTLPQGDKKNESDDHEGPPSNSI